MMMRPRPGFLRTLLLATMALPLVLPASTAGAAQTIEDPELDSLSGMYLAARTADVGKDIASAAAFYRSALENDPENLYLLERTVVLTAAAGDIDEAVAFAREMLDRVPGNPAARLIVAVDLIKQQRFADAAGGLADSDSSALTDLTRALLIAWAEFGQGEVDQAIAQLSALKGESWYEPFKLLHVGYIALASGRTEEALKTLAEARAADPNAVRVTEAYARALAVSGRSEEAESAIRDFITRFPDNALARAALADILAGRGQEIDVANPVIGAAEALAGIGAAVGQEGGAEIASLYLRLSLFLDPGTAGGLASLSLGNLLDASGQGDKAIATFESIAPEAPFRALGVLRAALALDRMDRTDEAERAFREAIRRDPEDVQSYISFGNMLRGRERFDEAAEQYTLGIDRIAKPTQVDWSLFYFRGIAYERTGDWDKAEADFREALKLYPEQPLVLNYLGYSLVDKGLKLDEALAMIRKAVELRPTDGYIVDSLGWAFYRLGRYDEAVTELERAIALRPEDPVIQDHLGDAYWKTGRRLEAQFQWRHARDFGAKGKDLDLILRKISEKRLIEGKKDASLVQDARARA